MKQLETMDLKIQNHDTIEYQMYKLLTEKMKYTEAIAKTIIYKIYDNTNQDYNFDYYFDYRDTIDEKTIAEFINQYTLHDKQKCENLEEAKCEFRCFIEEKCCMRETDWRYQDEFAKELSKIEIDTLDWLENIKCFVDWREVVDTLVDELWILQVNYDVLDMCKWRYRIAIAWKKQHDLFTTCFFDWKYKDEDRLVDWERKTLPTYWKEDIQDTKDEYLIQGLCKVNWFDIEDIFKYQMSEDEQRREQYPGIRDNNKFFDELYTELCNTCWYAEDLRFLTNMDIDELLLYTCVKNQKLNLRWCTFWFFDHINGSGSIFDWSIDFNYEVSTDEIDVMLYSNVHYFDDTYWFTNKPFWL